MKDFESWVLSYLLNSLWQVPFLFGAGWVVARALRPAGAEAEHRVWVGVLLMQVVLPGWSLMRLSWMQSSWMPWGWLGAILTWGATRPKAGAEVRVVMGGGVGAASFHFSPALQTAIVLAYGAAILFFAMRFVRRWIRLLKLQRTAVALSLTGEDAVTWKGCAARFGVGHVALATSSDIFGPVTLGVMRNMVLLPAAMVAGLSTAELETIIAHEFAHIRRDDFFKNLIYEVLSLPVSFHPLFWLTRERIMETREMVCDQIAAGSQGQKEYAKSLLRLASLLVQEVPIRTPHAIGIFDANTFERRVMRLTGKQQKVSGVRRIAMLASSAVFAAAVCGAVIAMTIRVDAQSNESSGANGHSSVHVSSGVMQGNLSHKVNPVYPVEAKKAKIQGTVVLKAVIGKDGAVENLSVESGPKELQQSALDAVRQWTYKPFLMNGSPVEVDTTINVVYTLAG